MTRFSGPAAFDGKPISVPAGSTPTTAAFAAPITMASMARRVVSCHRALSGQVAVGPPDRVVPESPRRRHAMIDAARQLANPGARPGSRPAAAPKPSKPGVDVVHFRFDGAVDFIDETWCGGSRAPGGTAATRLATAAQTHRSTSTLRAHTIARHTIYRPPLTRPWRKARSVRRVRCRLRRSRLPRRRIRAGFRRGRIAASGTGRRFRRPVLAASVRRLSRRSP